MYYNEFQMQITVATKIVITNNELSGKHRGVMAEKDQVVYQVCLLYIIFFF